MPGTEGGGDVVLFLFGCLCIPVVLAGNVP